MSDEPHVTWIDRLGGIILPATFVAILGSIALTICILMGKHIVINPGTEWVIWLYLGALTAGNAVYWAGRLRGEDETSE